MDIESVQEKNEGSHLKSVTCTAPVNIAIIKYWGKRCEKLNLPLNASLSVTLNKRDLKSTTSIAMSNLHDQDKVWLNGEEQDVKGNARLQICLQEMRNMARKQAVQRQEDASVVTRIAQKVHISSWNNFPTAAGLASSASGYAALVFTLGQLYGLDGDMSGIARRGSGSACRSMNGGFVEWVKGEDDETGSDSVARQLADENHWPELRVFILVVSAGKKAIGSTGGMRNSAETSTLLRHRVDHVVAPRLAALKGAILSKDFHSFAEICMKESNQLHAVCLDTYPPLAYLNETSHSIIRLVHRYNTSCDSVRLAYTFDAGPNACLFTLEPFAGEVAALLRDSFAPLDGENFFRGSPPELSKEPLPLKVDCRPGVVNYVICTSVGSGPCVEKMD